MTSSIAVHGAGPGRPRNGSIDTEVVATVLAMLRDGGYKAVSMDGIAKRLGCARTTLYRRWPDKPNLVAYAVVSEMGQRPAPDTGCLRNDLQATVSTLRRAFAGPLGRALAGLVSDMAQDTELAASIREQVLAPRRQSMREAIDRGVRRGEVKAGFDVELVLDMLTGPFYYRTLFGHARITAEMTERVVDYILRMVAARGSENIRR